MAVRGVMQVTLRFLPNLQFSKLKILFSSCKMKIILLQIHQKLTLNLFHILNHGHISKIKKNHLMVQTPQKWPFLRGKSGSLDVVMLGYVYGRKDLRSFLKILQFFKRVIFQVNPSDDYLKVVLFKSGHHVGDPKNQNILGTT